MRSLLRKLRLFRALPRSERLLLLEAAAALPLIACGLRLFGMQSFLASLERLAGRLARTDLCDDPAVRIARTRWLVAAAASNGLYRGTCLSRSTTLWWLLRRQGIASELRVGVRREGKALEAHAWIECGGVVVNERPETLESYTPFGETLTR